MKQKNLISTRQNAMDSFDKGSYEDFVTQHVRNGFATKDEAMILLYKQLEKSLDIFSFLKKQKSSIEKGSFFEDQDHNALANFTLNQKIKERLIGKLNSNSPFSSLNDFLQIPDLIVNELTINHLICFHIHRHFFEKINQENIEALSQELKPVLEKFKPSLIRYYAQNQESSFFKDIENSLLSTFRNRPLDLFKAFKNLYTNLTLENFETLKKQITSDIVQKNCSVEALLNFDRDLFSKKVIIPSLEIKELVKGFIKTKLSDVIKLGSYDELFDYLPDLMKVQIQESIQSYAQFNLQIQRDIKQIEFTLENEKLKVHQALKRDLLKIKTQMQYDSRLDDCKSKIAEAESFFLKLNALSSRHQTLGVDYHLLLEESQKTNQQFHYVITNQEPTFEQKRLEDLNASLALVQLKEGLDEDAIKKLNDLAKNLSLFETQKQVLEKAPIDGGLLGIKRKKDQLHEISIKIKEAKEAVKTLSDLKKASQIPFTSKGLFTEKKQLEGKIQEYREKSGNFSRADLETKKEALQKRQASLSYERQKLDTEISSMNLQKMHYEAIKHHAIRVKLELESRIKHEEESLNQVKKQTNEHLETDARQKISSLKFQLDSFFQTQILIYQEV